MKPWKNSLCVFCFVLFLTKGDHLFAFAMEENKMEKKKS